MISVHFLTFYAEHIVGTLSFFGILLGSCVLLSMCQSAGLTVGSCIIDNNNQLNIGAWVLVVSCNNGMNMKFL